MSKRRALSSLRREAVGDLRIKKTVTPAALIKNAAARVLNDKRLTAVIMINAVFSAFFLYTCLHTGLYGDDYGYRYVFAVGQKLTDNRVDSLADVVSSQFSHYQIMNGRTVAHFLLQFTLIWDHRLFSVTNTVIYCLLSVGLYLHTLSARDRRNGRHRPFAQLVIHLIPWILFPDYGNIYHIECLAANYLWTMAIIVWYLLPFRLLFDGCDIFHKKSRPFFGTALMFVFGTAAGWCSENGSAAALLLVGCMGLYYLIKKKNFPSWCLTGFIGALFGFIMMLLAPGYRIRTGESADFPIFDRLCAIASAHTLMPYGCFIVILLLCVSFLIYTDSHKKKNTAAIFAFFSAVYITTAFVLNHKFSGRIDSAYINLYLCCAAAVFIIILLYTCGGFRLILPNIIPIAYAAAAFIANLVLIAVPYVQKRNQLPFLLLISIPAAMLFEQTLERLRDRLNAGRVKSVFITALLVYSVVSLSTVCIKTRSDYMQFEMMERSIFTSKAKGVYDIVVKRPHLSGDRRTANLVMVNNDPNYWINQAFCQYYGIASVHFEAGGN